MSEGELPVEAKVFRGDLVKEKHSEATGCTVCVVGGCWNLAQGNCVVTAESHDSESSSSSQPWLSVSSLFCLLPKQETLFLHCCFSLLHCIYIFFILTDLDLFSPSSPSLPPEMKVSTSQSSCSNHSVLCLQTLCGSSADYLQEEAERKVAILVKNLNWTYSNCKKKIKKKN